MSDKTGIEWSDATWNPVTGCAKVSQGCKHCYAEREWSRMTKLVPAYAGRDFTDVRTHDDRLDQPLRWRKPRMIFVNSMSDLFHDDVPFEFIDRVFAVMALAGQHVFQVLTKRPARMREYLLQRSESMLASDWPASSPLAVAARIISKERGDALPNNAPLHIAGNWPLNNVWLGVSVEDQAAADERIPLLLDTPAAVRWISAEPLLGPVRLSGLFGLITDDEDVRINALEGTFITSRYQEDETPLGAKLDWVVVGGESGPKARPMHPSWARSLRDQCAEAGVPFLFKQWGEWWPNCFLKEDGSRDETTMWMDRVGKKRAGRLLDGVTHDGYPGSDK